MAESEGVIRYSDILLDDGAFNKLIEDLGKINQAYAQVASEAKKRADDLVKSTRKFNASSKEGQQLLLDVYAQVERLGQAYREFIIAQTEAGKAIQLIRAETRDLKKENVALGKSLKANSGSYERISYFLNDTITRYKALSEAERDNEQVGGALLKAIGLYAEKLQHINQTYQEQINLAKQVAKAEQELQSLQNPSEEQQRLEGLKASIEALKESRERELKVRQQEIIMQQALDSAKKTYAAGGDVDKAEFDALTKAIDQQQKALQRLAEEDLKASGSVDQLSLQLKRLVEDYNSLGAAGATLAQRNKLLEGIHNTAEELSMLSAKTKIQIDLANQLGRASAEMEVAEKDPNYQKAANLQEELNIRKQLIELRAKEASMSTDDYKRLIEKQQEVELNQKVVASERELNFVFSEEYKQIIENSHLIKERKSELEEEWNIQQKVIASEKELAFSMSEEYKQIFENQKLIQANRAELEAEWKAKQEAVKVTQQLRQAEADYVSGKSGGVNEDKAKLDAINEVLKARQKLATLEEQQLAYEQGSIVQLEAELQALTLSYRTMGEAEREAHGANVIARIEQIRESLTTLNGALNEQRNTYSELEKLQRKWAEVQTDEYKQTVELQEAIKSYTDNLKERVRLQQQLASLEDKKGDDKYISLKANVNQFNSELKESIRLQELEQILVNSEEGSMEKLAAQIEQLTIQISKMSAVERNSLEGQNMVKNLADLRRQLQSLEEQTGINVKSIGKFRGEFNNLRFATMQVVRELPSLAVSANTFFLAVSNNIPILLDEIKKLKIRNEELVKSGQSAIPIFKQIAAGILSWQTLLIIGMSLLSKYGKAVLEWVSALISGKQIAISFAEAITNVNKALKENDYSYAQNRATYERLRKEYNKTVLEGKSVLKFLNKYKDAVHSLGVELKTAAEAESYFRKKTKDVIDAFKLRAKAAAAHALAMEEYKKALSEEAGAANIKKRVEEIEKLQKALQDVDLSETKRNKLNKQLLDKAGASISFWTKVARVLNTVEGPTDYGTSGYFDDVATALRQLRHDIAASDKIVSEYEANAGRYMDLEQEMLDKADEKMKGFTKYDSKSGSGGAKRGREIENQINSMYTTILKKYQEGLNNLRDEFTKQAIDITIEATYDQGQLEDTKRKIEKILEKPDGYYKDLTEDVRKKAEAVKDMIDKLIPLVEEQEKRDLFKVTEKARQKFLSDRKEILESSQREIKYTDRLVKSYEEIARLSGEISKIDLTNSLLDNAGLTITELKEKVMPLLNMKDFDKNLQDISTQIDDISTQIDDIVKKGGNIPEEEQKQLNQLKLIYKYLIDIRNVERDVADEKTKGRLTALDNEKYKLEQIMSVEDEDSKHYWEHAKEKLELEGKIAFEQNKLLDANRQLSDEDLRQIKLLKEQLLLYKQQAHELDIRQKNEAALRNLEPDGSWQMTSGSSDKRFALQQQIEQLEASLKDPKIGQMGEKEAEAYINGIKSKLAKAKKELSDVWIETLESLGPTGFLLDALGMDEKNIKRLQSGLSTIVDSVKAAFEEMLQVQVELAEKEKEIADERLSNATTAYQAEVALRQAGYANNVDMARKDYLEAKKIQEQKAQAVLAAQQKQAAAQLQLDTLTQASSLITAAAQIYKALSPLGIIGIAAATAAIGGMFAAFISFKAQASSAASRASSLANSSTSNYGEGGLEFIGGGTHASGNDTDLGVKNSKGRRMKVERGEAVAIINHHKTKKYKKVLPAIVESLNKGTFEEKFGNNLSDMPQVASTLAGPTEYKIDLSKLENTVINIWRKMNDRETILSDGTRIIHKNNTIRRIKQ